MESVFVSQHQQQLDGLTAKQTVVSALALSPHPSPPPPTYNFDYDSGSTRSNSSIAYSTPPLHSTPPRCLWHSPAMDSLPSPVMGQGYHTSSSRENSCSASGSASDSPCSQADALRMVTPSSTSTSGPTHAAAKDAAGATAPSVPAACLACRGKHLKCDGQSPCSRCTSFNSECIYVASRRGYKGPRRNIVKKPTNNRHQGRSPGRSPTIARLSPARSSSARAESRVQVHSKTPGSSDPFAASFTPNMVLMKRPTSSPFLSPEASPNSTSHSTLYTSHPMPTIESTYFPVRPHHQLPSHGPLPTLAEQCRDSFFRNFHPSHPFVLPEHYFRQVAHEQSVEVLSLAMQWIGSLYIDAGPARATLLNQALRLASDPNRATDGFLAQALLLIVLGLDGKGDQAKAMEVLADAEHVALKIGLNTCLFAENNGRGMAVLEESWRRTWWDLFVVDGMMAGVHRATNFFLFEVPSDVGLPCEEHEYLAGLIPTPTFLEEMDDADFTGAERVFSSFAYRIRCAQNLGKFLRTTRVSEPKNENLHHIETLLANWKLHLPASKRESPHVDGQLDEMMFQAHMMLHTTSILLHQPHSQLDPPSGRSVNADVATATMTSAENFNSHTKRATQAANDISRLVARRGNVLSHSPFFIFAITLSSVMHLSKWSFHFVPRDDEALRQQIVLNIGALTQLGHLWIAARGSSRYIQAVAQEVSRVKEQQQMTSQYWMGFSGDESFLQDIDRSLSNASGMGG